MNRTSHLGSENRMALSKGTDSIHCVMYDVNRTFRFSQQQFPYPILGRRLVLAFGRVLYVGSEDQDMSQNPYENREQTIRILILLIVSLCSW